MQRREVGTFEYRDFVIRECVYAPGTRMPRHAHGYSNVTVVISGEIEETTDRGTYRGLSGSVVLKPAGCQHDDRVSGIGARTLSIELYDGSAAEDIARRPWSWVESSSVVRAALALRLAGMSHKERCARTFLSTVFYASSPEGAPVQGPSWLPAMIALLEKQFDEPMKFASLAREFGLHPVYVSRAFHRHVRLTPNEYLREVRLRHARHLLASTRRSVTAIAVESGFFDSSHFSRTFSRSFGMTPRAYRRLMGEVYPVQITGHDSHSIDA